MRNLHLILVLAVGLLPLAAAQAAPADVPETGQTTCYDVATNLPIACTGTGQDGEHLAGVAWPNPRFVVNECGTPGVTSDDVVTDNLTGLMWVRAPSATGDWATALTNANGLTHCGFIDWRLPNVNELESLVNSEAANPATFLNGEGFSGVAAGSYWSSTTSLLFSDTAWLVLMSNGRVDTNMKTFSNGVWPVRAGP